MTDLDIRPLGGTTSDPEDWRAQALCAQTDPEAFFPEKGEWLCQPKLAPL